MKRKISFLLVVTVLLVMSIGAFGSVYAADAVIGKDPCELRNTDTIPEVTKAIQSIDDPIKKDLIIKYLFTPTSVETKITSSKASALDRTSAAEFDDSMVEQNAEQTSLLLDQIDLLLDMPVNDLKAEVASIELKGQKVMEEVSRPLNNKELNQIKEFSELNKVAASSYETTFTKLAKSGSLTVLSFEVVMNWQSSSNQITYCAPSSFADSYVWYWGAYAISSQNPVVSGSYATLTGKKATFREVDVNGNYGAGYYYITMPTLRVNADGSYTPTSIPPVSM